MLAFMPTPLVSWPLQPISLPVGQLIALFIMLAGKLKPHGPPAGDRPLVHWAPPPSRSLQRLQTFWPAMLLPSFATIVAVHVPGVQYRVPAKAVSKKGWGVTAAAFWAQFEPASPASPPQYCSATWA